jgi:hypothetical protein
VFPAQEMACGRVCPSRRQTAAVAGAESAVGAVETLGPAAIVRWLLLALNLLLLLEQPRLDEDELRYSYLSERSQGRQSQPLVVPALIFSNTPVLP